MDLQYGNPHVGRKNVTSLVFVFVGCVCQKRICHSIFKGSNNSFTFRQRETQRIWLGNTWNIVRMFRELLVEMHSDM